jgi:tetratricopeptide (TPR) repeat protein
MVILQININQNLSINQKNQMRHLILPLIGIISLLTACNSPKNTPYLEEQFDKAITFNDNITAIYYLHEIRAAEPKNNSVYIRLGDLYSKMGNYKGALTAIKVALRKANELETKDLLFAQVRSHKGLKQHKEAIAILDTLCLLDKERDIEYKYEIAILAFEAKDLQNALVRMNDVLKHPTAGEVRKVLNSDLGQDNVSYYLAALNFIGYIKIATGDFDTADKIYAEILSKTQAFKLANSNYQLLVQEKERKAKTK